MQKQKIEIMSPVGSYEALAAAIQGGANSVYFGVGNLNMRSRSSKNFTLEDLAQISKIAQEAKIKTYLTLNTVIYEHEIEEMQKTIDAAIENDISAVIASDISVLQYAFNKGMEVHISTQCNITNIEAVKFYSNFADVMVTARELNLDQVADISAQIEKENICGPKGNLVQIEVFAHGALCMAVSGKCYLSLDNHNSSANRGACFQPCRRKYKVTDLEGDIELEIDNKYIMSPKDLKTIDFIGKVINAGVKVLKIEGRGRGPEYVKTVTQCYREAADAYIEGTFSTEKLENWNKRLKEVYNRDFWGGYYLGKKMGEWTNSYGSQATTKKSYIGKITNYFAKIGVAEITLEAGDLKVGDTFRIIGETTGVYENSVKEIRVDYKTTQIAEKKSICSISVETAVRRGDKIYKVIHKNSDTSN